MLLQGGCFSLPYGLISLGVVVRRKVHTFTSVAPVSLSHHEETLH